MLKSEFHFDLPEELIAQAPLARRDASRLLCLKSAAATASDCIFRQFEDLLGENDLLVMNDTRVIPARLYASKQTGGKLEILLERLLDDRRCLVQIRASKSPRVGSRILLADDIEFEVLQRHDDLYELGAMGDIPLLQILEAYGHVPLPPYIRRADDQQDQSRYQTVYASEPGAVAAPTAGLHFDEAMMEKLRRKGVRMETITLHVGAGTFQPVRVDHIEDHALHKEQIIVSQQVVDAVAATRQRGGKVVAVGTTSVRALESAAAGEQLEGRTDIFIHRGFDWQIVDLMMTNFHMPRTTLLMMIDGFVGDRWRSLYGEALRADYRFLSFGDAMLLDRHA